MFQSKDVMATVLIWDIATVVRGTFKFFDLPSNATPLPMSKSTLYYPRHMCQSTCDTPASLKSYGVG